MGRLRHGGWEGTGGSKYGEVSRGGTIYTQVSIDKDSISKYLEQTMMAFFHVQGNQFFSSIITPLLINYQRTNNYHSFTSYLYFNPHLYIYQLLTFHSRYSTKNYLSKIQLNILLKELINITTPAL